MKEKHIILAAKVISIVFTPFYLPLLGLVLLFALSHLSMLPATFKLEVLLLVYVFTALLPTLFIKLYRRMQGWSRIDLGQKERRMVPYIISIACYFTCYYVMNRLQFPRFMSNILMAALMIQLLCAVINIWWKISTHSAAIGGVAGALLAFSAIFIFNPVKWLSLVMIVAGLVGTSRMILRQHTLEQVVAGFAVGFIVGLTFIG
ncbi:MAG: phosphatase PAP2 family protein [Prevotella sp.]|jgi:membrane-associated phospholipid phosphatase|nr:phosphatase PAP2 family protein [Prevotella sp.]MBR1518788.1 phosphatase PAP2 family protein [Prevotella sp.]